MTKIQTVDVDLGDQSYAIHIGRGLVRRITDYVPLDMTDSTLFVLTDENVSNPHAMAVFQALKSTKALSVQMLAIPAGESSKSIESYERVLAWLLDHDVNRSSVLFAVGGGVIGDLGGFAAASVMRGIPFVQVPTTLLAQVDSSVGGKTGINMKQGKNLVGAFYQPKAVICDLDTLQTLPRRELLAGYAEVAKYGLINDAAFFKWLEDHGENVIAQDNEALTYAISQSCQKKADVVRQDEKEQGIRALLNLGHTFAHALEGAAGYDGRLLHGEAVSIGMVLAFELSVEMGLASDEDLQRVRKHLTDIGLPTSANMIFPPLDNTVDELLVIMKRDKKISKGTIVFILARAIGQSFVSHDVDMNDVHDVFSQSMKEI